MSKEIEYKWESIMDLPKDYKHLSSKKLNEISKELFNIRKKIDDDVFQQIEEKIKRRWVIELGQVNNIYFIDNFISNILVENGFSHIELPYQTDGLNIIDPLLFLQRQENLLNNIYSDAIDNIYISKHMMKSMHSLLVQDQDYVPENSESGNRVYTKLLKGLFKSLSNDTICENGKIHQYCPPELVESEINSLISMHNRHLELKVPVEIEAAWFHHRFSQISPFQGGNGRMATSLTALIYIRAGFFPPIICLNDKDKYLSKLNAANKGNLKVLIEYLANLLVDEIKYSIKIFKSLKK